MPRLTILLLPLTRRGVSTLWLVLLSDPISKDTGCGVVTAWFTFVYRIARLHAVGILCRLGLIAAPCAFPFLRVALPLPFLDFIIAPIQWFVKGFYKKNSSFFNC